MLLLAVSLMCFSTLLIEGRGVLQYDCDEHIPKKAKDVLVKALNDRRSKDGKVPEVKYDCEEGSDAFNLILKKGAAATYFDAPSVTFDFDWEKTLKKAVKDIKKEDLKRMWDLKATKVGCGVHFYTKDDGHHEFELNCNYSV
ncbi:hypothetical protein V3C99_014518 [Haemonchus contortus]